MNILLTENSDQHKVEFPAPTNKPEMAAQIQQMSLMIAESLHEEDQYQEDSSMNIQAVTLPLSENSQDVDDAVGALFKQMSRYPLLNQKEELELARLIQELIIFEQLPEKLANDLG
ncbi:MAG: RNA polymerase sigma factor, RpoD/SigA family, partial [Okeania sp. SIO3B3]|nr:RNA polymerase sigma factor, RpoD/SigA family [Okeania sp. SIO3B3]